MRKHLSVLALAAGSRMTALAASDEDGGHASRALLLKGGQRSANYQSHLHHVDDMLALLEERGVARGR